MSAHIGKQLPSGPGRRPTWQQTPKVSAHIGPDLPRRFRQRAFPQLASHQPCNHDGKLPLRVLISGRICQWQKGRRLLAANSPREHIPRTPDGAAGRVSQVARHNSSNYNGNSLAQVHTRGQLQPPGTFRRPFLPADEPALPREMLQPPTVHPPYVVRDTQTQKASE